MAKRDESSGIKEVIEKDTQQQERQKMQNQEQKYCYTVMEEQEGIRLDQFLAGEFQILYPKVNKRRSGDGRREKGKTRISS